MISFRWWGLFDKTAAQNRTIPATLDRITSDCLFDLHCSDWTILYIFFISFITFFSVTFKPHCISPEREQWIFLCVENRRGLRSFSISTNPLLNCLPWCVCYHRKRLQHFVYLTSFNIKAQLKCCTESWISLLRRLWALTHAYTH